MKADTAQLCWVYWSIGVSGGVHCVLSYFGGCLVSINGVIFRHERRLQTWTVWVGDTIAWNYSQIVKFRTKRGEVVYLLILLETTKSSQPCKKACK